MSAFTKWYISMLHQYPLRANIASAAILMTVGDLMAQGIESYQGENDIVLSAPRRNTNQLSYRRYGTWSPDQEKRRRQQQKLLRHPLIEYENLDMDTEYITLRQLYEAIVLVVKSITLPIQSLDYFRTGTMVGWAVAFYTPFYVTLYRGMDFLFPKTITPFTVLGRASLSFLCSIPVNAAFFCYGSFMHHITGWLALVFQEYQQQRTSSTQIQEQQDIVEEIPFDMEMLWSSTRLKLEAELVPTVQISAGIWIPINLVNFSLVPAHMRPLVLMICSVFWNCYLSLAQHRSEEF